jgi:uncharacterized protein (DUF779 family)
VHLDTVGGAAFWLGREQHDFLSRLQLTLDVAPGHNGNFSREDGSGQRSCSTCACGMTRKCRPHYNDAGTAQAIDWVVLDVCVD